MEELSYTIGANVLKYEPKYFLGFGITELLLATVAGVFGMMTVGLVPGVIIGGAVLIALKRYEGLGNRSLPEFFFLWVSGRMSPKSVIIPRTFPVEGAVRVEYYSWQGNLLYAVKVKGERDDI